MALCPQYYRYFDYYYCKKCNRGLKIWDETDETFDDRICECGGKYIFHTVGWIEGVAVNDPYPAETLH